MDLEMSVDDVTALVSMLQSDGVDLLQHKQMSLSAQNVLTVPEDLADKVKAVMQRHGWREQGIKRTLQSALADLRFRYEAGGVILDGQHIPTDRDNRSELLLLTVMPGKMLPWRDSTGRWIDFDEAKLKKVQDAIRAHLQRSAETELKIYMQIDQGHIKTSEDVEKQFNAAVASK